VAAPPPQSKVTLDAEKLQAIRDGLWMVVNGAGTGGRARIAGRDVAGKTGTAQVISNQGKTAAGRSEKDLRDNGWFVFFAPRDNPEIAGAILLEHGMHGPNAASLARHVLDTFFAKKDGRPLPVPPDDFHLQIDDVAPTRKAPVREDDPEPQTIAMGSTGSRGSIGAPGPGSVGSTGSLSAPNPSNPNPLNRTDPSNPNPLNRTNPSNPNPLNRSNHSNPANP
jgi:membrane peptidoglycan carboxypeptidase